MAANTLIVSIQAVLLIPLYLRYVGPTLYGAWLSSGDVLVWLQAFDLGLPNLMIQRIGRAHGAGDLRTVGKWLATGTLAMAVTAGVVSAIGLLGAHFVPEVFHVVGSDAVTLRRCFSLAVVASGAILLNQAVVGYSRGVQATAFMNTVLLLSGVVGLITSATMVLRGAGLWAIPGGMVARAAVSLGGSVVFVYRQVGAGLTGRLAFDRAVFREIIATAPSTGVGGLSYALMNQSDTALVGAVCGPSVAAVYGITKKPADVLRGIVDTVGTAAYGGFAHLVGSQERGRALYVLHEITVARESMAVVAAAVFAAGNASVISAWVGPERFAGNLVNGLLAVQLVVLGSSYLANYLYRATGPVAHGSWLLFAESAVRLPLAIALLVVIGLPGLPLAAVATATVAAVVARRLIMRSLSDVSRPPLTAMPFMSRTVVLGVGITVGARFPQQSWTGIMGLCAATGLAAAAVVGMGDPTVRALARRVMALRRVG